MMLRPDLTIDAHNLGLRKCKNMIDVLPREGGRNLAWCPACSAGMVDRSCKRRCPRCGYFEDCSNLI